MATSSSEKPQLSIIIISYNTSKITKKCLDTVVDSLQKGKNMSAEIIVLDNDSKDDSPEMLKTYKRELKKDHSSISMQTILLDKNLGFGKGNNKAAERANGTYLLFLNSDIEVLDDAIPQMITLYKQHDFDFAGAKLLNKDMSPQPSAGKFYTPFVAFAALFLQADSWGYSRSSPSEITKTDWVSGACFLTTKEKYQSIDGFDENIFMYWEEVDLFYRAHTKGYTTGFFPQPRFIHLEGASSKSRTGPILKVFQGYIYFYKKHHSLLQLRMIQYMLQIKSIISLAIGHLTRNNYLITTYKQAYEIAKKD